MPHIPHNHKLKQQKQVELKDFFYSLLLQTKKDIETLHHLLVLLLLALLGYCLLNPKLSNSYDLEQ